METILPESVRIVEVGARDGLQNEARAVPVAVRIMLIDRLKEAGLKSIEAGSFVHPEWVPQMANSDQVLAALDQTAGHYPVLVPNMRGFDDALAAGAREIAVFAAASESFSQKNIHCSIEQSMQRFRDVIRAARQNDIRIRGYISCVLGCPYEGEIAPFAVVDVARRLYDLGCYEISLGDTIGTGTPGKARALIEKLTRHIDVDKVAVHFHDTYGQALANIYAALETGVSVIDSAVAGLGGCPYANGASGNVATEDVVYLLNGLGIRHDVDLTALVKTGRFICQYLGRPVMSKVNLAYRL